MSQSHDHNEKGLETVERGVEAVSLADKTLGVAEGLKLGHHAAPMLMRGLGAVLGPLGLFAGAGEMAIANREMAHGEVGKGALTMASGLSSVIGGGASALGALSTATSTGVAPVLGMSAAHAAPGALFTTAGGAVSAPAVAGVAGAAGLGLAAGTAMQKASDSDYTRTGFWGQDKDTGRKHSAMDWASQVGLDYDRNHGVKPGESSAVGSALAMGAGVVAGVGGTVQAGWNAASQGIGRQVDGVGRWFGGLDHQIRQLYGAP